MNDTLQGRLYSQLQASPDRRALGFYDAAGRTSWRSYGDLYREASATSHWLADHGLVRGEVCILVLPSDEFCATALLATLMLGAIPLLIAPPALQGQHSMAWSVLTGMIRKTNAKLVICSESLKGMRNELERGQRKARFLFDQPSVSAATVEMTAPEIPAETDLATYQLTSGTTGFPRVCVWRQ